MARLQFFVSNTVQINFKVMTYNFHIFLGHNVIIPDEKSHIA